MEWLGDLSRGDFRLGDAAEHKNLRIEGIASSLKYRRPVKVTRKSVILKCKVSSNFHKPLLKYKSYREYQKSETVG